MSAYTAALLARLTAHERQIAAFRAAAERDDAYERQIAARLPPGAVRHAPCPACASGISAPCEACGRPADRPAAARPASVPREDRRSDWERDEDARDEYWQRRVAEARGK